MTTEIKTETVSERVRSERRIARRLGIDVRNLLLAVLRAFKTRLS